MKRQGPVIFSEIAPLAGLEAALRLRSDEVIDEVRASAVKGRGGAGFLTGLKWDLAAAEPAETKFVVCNADEGEPGTFKDRVLLGEYAPLVFEGMIIAGYAIGAQRGIVYLRGEYKYLKPELEAELARFRNQNALGEGILGHAAFDFDIEIKLGSGAYICGEETALIESMEGQRGEPRNRPPFPASKGFLGCPTIVNNVETMAAIPHILAKGAAWFRSIGSAKSAGSKVLSVSGDCGKPGVYEVEFGTTIASILRMVDAEDTKAVQVGGASGICIGQSEFGRKIAFEDLPTGGSIIIFNSTRNMVDAAENFLSFFKEESCGHCTPCREGIPVLLDGVQRIKQGTCSRDYLEDLFSLCETMQCASKCGLGQSAPNTLLSVLERFLDDTTLQAVPAKDGLR